VLALALASVGTIVTSLVMLALSKGVRRRWLWVVGCLFGYGQIAVDWSSGALSFTPLNVQLLGAFVMKTGEISPWRVGFGVPVFAIIFLIRRQRLMARGRDAQMAGDVSPTPPSHDA
jgi:hypothetical protein